MSELPDQDNLLTLGINKPPDRTDWYQDNRVQRAQLQAGSPRQDGYFWIKLPRNQLLFLFLVPNTHNFRKLKSTL